MREADRSKSRKNYAYCVLRIRVTDGSTLQGNTRYSSFTLWAFRTPRNTSNVRFYIASSVTSISPFRFEGTFFSRETIGHVHQFLSSMITDEATEFYLQTLPSRDRYDDPKQTLLDAGLVPSAILSAVPSHPTGSLILRPVDNLPSPWLRTWRVMSTHCQEK